MRTYNPWQEGCQFRYPFAGCENIKETHSQAYQDIFVLSLLGGVKNGEYFEIGCNIPDYTNNTYLLAKNFDWNGTSIDLLDFSAQWKSQRPNNRFFQCDALTVNYQNLLGESRTIDYLQLDIEPPENTLKALQNIPHDCYRFKVITFETDFYMGGTAPWVRQQSRNLLSSLGYSLVVPDVIVDNGNPYEDWWVDLNLVNQEVALEIQEMAKITQKPFELLFRI